MSDLTTTKRGQLTKFKPEGAGIREAGIKAAVETAKRIREWQSLWDAVDDLIEQERQIIAWWDGNVAPNHRPRKSNAERHYLPMKDAESKLKVRQDQISRWRKWLKREDEYRAVLYGPTYKKATITLNQHYRAEGSGQNEWYTPALYIEAARKVLGEIDLDPASSEEAQKVIRAKQYFDAKTDGLSQDWNGKVWINPPFSRDLIARFVNKLIEEFSLGRTTQAILLTHNNTDTEWFHSLARVSKMLCFTRGRIPFYRGDWIAAPPNGQTFFYLGNNHISFQEVFSALGLVMVPSAT